jgi:hypothetical protein
VFALFPLLLVDFCAFLWCFFSQFINFILFSSSPPLIPKLSSRPVHKQVIKMIKLKRKKVRGRNYGKFHVHANFGQEVSEIEEEIEYEE